MRIQLAVKILRDRIAMLRGERSDESMAKEMGIDPSTFRHWHGGSLRVRLSTLIKIERWCDRESDHQSGIYHIHDVALDDEIEEKSIGE